MTTSSMTTSASGASGAPGAPSASGASATMTPTGPKMRISSIDILRGLVMVIMALDHIRDNFHRGNPNPTDLYTTTPALFFTRWITHFCAPAFVFLSGVSAYLAGTRRTKNELGVFLIKRGLWLILLELTVITFAFFLDPGFHFLLLQVIWVIGGSMIILGLLVRLKVSPGDIGTIGAVIFFGHNLLDYMEMGELGRAYWWKMLWSCSPSPSSITSIGGGHSLAT
ncbi:MAG TPA: heparan-alpha-glucosaminide N-acetyltransferase domain-containing protein, partial [Verrucomicrobiae bacterium]|nr:heparan-alpha-glucosaminide N-acetyltransferase domain-containing protein [Verrucomicrobiae bacterium]